MWNWEKCPLVPPNSKIIIQRFHIQQLKDEFIARYLRAYVGYPTWFILLWCTKCDIMRDILKSFYNLVPLHWNIKKKVHDKHVCYILYLLKGYHNIYFIISSESYFGDSFCTIQAFQDVYTFHLSLQIKTSRRSGLLFLAAGMEDYLFLELQNERIEVNVNNTICEFLLKNK